jgi:hypothetical protein
LISYPTLPALGVAVGLGALEQALDELKNEVQAELHFNL